MTLSREIFGPEVASAKGTWRGSLAALVLALLVVGGVVAYEGIWAPRPYYVTQIDAEQDYYYNAQLIAAHQPVTVHHPGTPIYYLGYALLRIAGGDPANTQHFFNLAYLVIALFAAFGLVVFWRLVLRNLPFGIALGALAAVVAWPPFLTYLNFFNADGFILAVGLPAFALGWYILRQPVPSPRLLGAGGALLGLCLAVKMSFVPLVIALGCGYASHALIQVARERPGQGAVLLARAAVVRIVPFGLGLVGGFGLAVLPIINRVPRVFERTFLRPDTAPRGGFLPDVTATFVLLDRANVAWLVLGALAVMSLVVGVAIVVMDRPRPTAAPAPTVEFDYTSAALVLGLLFLALIYTAAAAAVISSGSEAGIRVRNMSPTMLAVPFAIVFGFQALTTASLSVGLRRFAGVVVGVCGAVAIVLGVCHQLRERRAFIAERTARIAATRARLGSLTMPPARMAFWTESAQDFLGDASFHFWGNYRYANGYFDPSLLIRYPGLAFFGLRNLQSAPSDADDAPAPPGRSRHGWVGDAYWTIRHGLFRDRQHYTHTGVVITAESQGTLIGAIAVPSEELVATGLSESELAAAVTKRYAAPAVEHVMIAGVDWTVLRLPNPAQLNGAHLPAGTP